jgi:di/tricarboxylate transporter
MTGDMLFVFCVLGVAVVLFASGRVRLDVVALLVLLALMLSGILSVPEALAGFSDPVIIMIAGLFVVGEALVTTGIAFAVGEWMMRVGGTSEIRLVTLLMLTVGLAGAFISSTGIVAIFIPIALSIAAKTGVARSRLLMPLSFAALISGMMTLIATAPNLVAAYALEREGFEPFEFFEFTPIGLAVLAVGTAYMLLVGRRLLPTADAEDAGAQQGQSIGELVRTFGLADKNRRLRVASASPLVGQTVAELQLRSRLAINLVSVERRHGRRVEVMPGMPHTKFQADDVIYVFAEARAADEFIASQALVELPAKLENVTDLVREMGVAEVMLAPDSDLLGKTLRGAALQSRHQVQVLAVLHDRKPLEGDLRDATLHFGDILLVSGRWQAIRNLQSDKKDFVVLSLPLEIDDVAPARRQAPWALLILGLMVSAMTLELVHNVAAVLIAALAMITTRCLSMDEAYKAINWPSLVLIAGMLPLATALKQTGGADLMVDGLVYSIGDFGPLAVMAGLFALTSVLGLFVSNTATAVMLAPIAVGVALDMGVAPAPYVMTVAVAASAAFMTPVSSPVNTLVVEPGGYGFIDFVKIGVPMTLLTGAVSMILIPLLFPL